MAKRRYTIDANTGLLVDREGVPLGRVLSLTIDLPERGTIGGSCSVLPSSTTEEEREGTDGVEGWGAGKPKSSGESRPTATQLERQAVQRIWDHWLELSGKRQRLDTKRERIIRNALHLVGEESTKRALLGLTRSPHHQGQNDQHRAYMEVRYALKGLGDESDDERIEKAITWAAIYAPAGGVRVDEAKVRRWLDEVRYTLSLPHRPEAERGREAYKKLVACGFTVERLDRAPWARVTR